MIVKDHMIHGPCGIHSHALLKFNEKANLPPAPSIFLKHACNPAAPCMKNKKCSKGFPKEFREFTEEDKNGFPLYRRRAPRQLPLGCGMAIKKVNGKEVVVDNRWVVPYNPNLLLCLGLSIFYIFVIFWFRWWWSFPHPFSCTQPNFHHNSHLNVEVSAQIENVKYLHKYLVKMPDRAEVAMQLAEQDLDETRVFLDGRYISTS